MAGKCALLLLCWLCCTGLPAQPDCYVVGNSARTVQLLTQGGHADEGFARFLRAQHCTFAGVPYGSGGKGSKQGQALINLETMDCLTYVENMLALYITRRMNALQADTLSTTSRLHLFARNLNYIRYDRGINCVWEDRLFYFTGAMMQLANYGILQDVSAWAGEPYTKHINYVSTHRSAYPGIQNWPQVLRLERELSHMRRYWYPREEYTRYVALAQDGDIIAFASTLDGLDISHVGFVLRQPDGELGLNHSSSIQKQLICNQNLCAYLEGRKTVNGFFVYRFNW
jgi:hypothetical protein